MRTRLVLSLALTVAALVSAAPAAPPKPMVIPFDFESKFGDGTYGQQLGDMFWTKIKRQGGFVLPESMQEVREWCERNHFTPGPDTPMEKMKQAVKTEQAGDVGIWGKIERVAGNETDVYDLWINVVDFSTDPPRIIYQKKARTQTVSEIPHIYIKEAMEALTGKVVAAFPTRENSPPKGSAKGSSLVNGDFEDGRRSPLGWDPLTPLMSVKAERGASGTNHYLHFNIPQTEAENAGVLYYSDFFPVEAGKTYRFQCRWRTSGCAVKVFVKCYDEFATRFARDGGNSADLAKREVYRSQQNLTGPSNSWNEQVEDFTPKHSKFQPKWGRVMLYGYFPAGTVDWDDVSVTRVSPSASDDEPKR
jgi:hypothetical protein